MTKALVLGNHTLFPTVYTRKGLNRAVAKATGLNLRIACRLVRDGTQIGDMYLRKIHGYGGCQWYAGN